MPFSFHSLIPSTAPAMHPAARLRIRPAPVLDVATDGTLMRPMSLSISGSRSIPFLSASRLCRNKLFCIGKSRLRAGALPCRSADSLHSVGSFYPIVVRRQIFELIEKVRFERKGFGGIAICVTLRNQPPSTHEEVQFEKDLRTAAQAECAAGNPDRPSSLGDQRYCWGDERDPGRCLCSLSQNEKFSLAHERTAFSRLPSAARRAR